MSLPPWATAVILLLMVGYAVPYLILPGREAWTGAFLFWIVFGGAVWVILVAAVARWRPDPGPRDPSG